MGAVLTFFPVDNGDMTLITLSNKQTILIDVNIRQPGNCIRDVETDLRQRLKSDADGRPYVDVMVLSHPDQDHCRKFADTFHTGPISDYKTPSDGTLKKIIIREMWSSPMVFRRASSKHTLCDDAKAWNREARRRVDLLKERGWAATGDRILVLGEDENGKTDDLGVALIRAGQTISALNGESEVGLQAVLIGPLPKGSEAEEEIRKKNDSSIILQFRLAHGWTADACRFLTGGDCEVAIWERVWSDNKDDTTKLDYDVMLAPHHCSWHSLSYDSWNELGDDVEVSAYARNALGQARDGAYIVSSSKPVSDGDSDPPCIRAKREYESILKGPKGSFVNTATHEDKDGPVPMEFDVTSGGVVLRTVKKSAPATRSAASVGVQPLWHG